jgi:hypothetical protein
MPSRCPSLTPLALFILYQAYVKCQGSGRSGTISSLRRRLPGNLPVRTALTRHLHWFTSIQANRWQGTPGRKTWFEYWEAALTYPESYFARLSYVHRNAVHHAIVREPSLYPWCSAGWFQRRASTPFGKSCTRRVPAEAADATLCVVSSAERALVASAPVTAMKRGLMAKATVTKSRRPKAKRPEKAMTASKRSAIEGNGGRLTRTFFERKSIEQLAAEQGVQLEGQL